MLCKYKNVFGKPGEGVHSIRFLNIAIVDLLMTVLAGFMISQISGVNFWYVLIALLIIGILAHRAFCVNTTVNKAIFGKV